MSFGCRKGTVKVNDEPKATPRGDEARAPRLCKLFRFRRTGPAAFRASCFARARAEIRRCRACLQAGVGDRRPDHAEACNNLGRVLQAQGKTKNASAYYARSLEL